MTEESDTIETVASALDALADGVITIDEWDLRIHDKRYHKHGYKEGDVCKYREGSSSPHSDNPLSVAHYEKLLHGCDVEKSREFLTDIAKIHVVMSDCYEELVDGGFDKAIASSIIEWGEFLPKEIQEKNIRLFCTVVRDLKERYSKFSLLNPYLISLLLHDVANNRAISTKDKRHGIRTNFIALGDYYSGDLAKVNKYHNLLHYS